MPWCRIRSDRIAKAGKPQSIGGTPKHGPMPWKPPVPLDPIENDQVNLVVSMGVIERRLDAPRISARLPSSRPLSEGRCANPSDVEALNEGRGANPGDTIVTVRTKRVSAPAQQRPGCESRRHHLVRLLRCDVHVRSTKAGVRIPATRGTRYRAGTPTRPLNEGRGAIPATQSMDSTVKSTTNVAQRTPGCESRRHPRRPR